ncbi:MAG: hypothetical protein NDJ92_19400 [Thermoanaerobaculia bacterium]|nr:hypothetical protein [Thermoanaerobaculia bacterium]
MSDDTRDLKANAGTYLAQPDYNRVIRTCPVCSKELEERKCKLICTDPRCGYYMSCADFY